MLDLQHESTVFPPPQEMVAITLVQVLILSDYSQLRQNYLNNYFQAEVGKELPKQFPDAFSVSKLHVGNFAFSKTQTLCKTEMIT